MRVQGKQRPRLLLDTLAEEKGISRAVAQQTGTIGLRFVHRGYADPADTESEFMDRRLDKQGEYHNELILPYRDTLKAVNGLVAIYKDPHATINQQMEAKVLHALYERAVMFNPQDVPEPLGLRLDFASGRQLDERFEDIARLDEFIIPMSPVQMPDVGPRVVN